ncbi:DUF1285 domain-containing protein [Martelella mediterranea]|uniref:DUF1285 domain-containing protein n=1 Tax=Martelella mediterranea TaxID=293089 RepID=A0A4R3NXD5_9HYPH|nr:DUF1285 domain-containing protein [Martelella mediterranea]TCT44897.1 hypothetical protein EDC90_100134 [Martelella mediterranea]
MAENGESGKNDASGLAASIARQSGGEKAGKRGPAPVEKWDPAFCGDIDMEIRRDGTWFYCGTPIGRASLVQLFATVLRKDEDGETYLVTPVEKVRIRVEDAPFQAVGMTTEDHNGEPVLAVSTNVGDTVSIDADHPLRFDVVGENAELKPYVLVRGRLEALFSRALTYDLMALGEAATIKGEEMFVIRSAGQVFPVMAMSQLEQNR